MTKKKLTPIIALAVCAIALAAVASVKNPVTRPIKGVGYVTARVDLTTGTFLSGTPDTPNWGESTHTGRFSNEASGNFFTGAISGTVTAANGDKVFWEQTGPTSVRFTGGTGRFEGITGGFTMVISDLVVTYPDANTMMISETYHASGTATY